MAVRLRTIVIDCHDDRRLRDFWCAALGYEPDTDHTEDWILLRDPAGIAPRIGLQVVPEPKIVKNRLHLDLEPTAGGLEDEARRLEGIGARRVRYVENDPDESHWVLADPEGNEFCLLRPPWEPRPAGCRPRWGHRENGAARVR